MLVQQTIKMMWHSLFILNKLSYTSQETFLQTFGDVLGLHTNLQKSCVIPIRYEGEIVEESTAPYSPQLLISLPHTWDCLYLTRS